MKFCTKCGQQMTDEMIFCQNCGTKNSSAQSNTSDSSSQMYPSANFEQKNTESIKLRTGMMIWMIIFFVFAGIFAIGTIADISMLSGVCLFGIFGLMFYILAKTPKGSVKLFSQLKCFQKTNGISKGAFVGICIFLAFFLFTIIINTFNATTSDINQAENNTPAVSTEEKKKEIPEKKEPEIPVEFENECPISVSASMYDNIIGYPELQCYIKNNTDKEISAIQLYFAPKDVYGEDADNIFSQNKLQCDTPISANGSDTITWQMIDQSIKSGDLYIYSVYFADGTEWGDRNAPISKIKQYAVQLQAGY